MGYPIYYFNENAIKNQVLYFDFIVLKTNFPYLCRLVFSIMGYQIKGKE